LEELQAFNKDFSEEGEEETAALTLEAVRVLRENLDSIKNEKEILLLCVG
jgi:hypothetical protein